MTKPPNQSATVDATIPAAKPKKTTKATKPKVSPTKGKYQWASGGKIHSVSQATHDQRVQAQQVLGTQDLTAPPTATQAITEANSAADLQFGPQVQAAQQQAANVAPWYQDYMARVAGYATAAQKLAQPVLDQAQTAQANAATQTPAGLDPNSVAGQQAAQAAQGRASIQQLGLDALNTNANATQDYFGGQQAAAAKEQPGAQTAAATALASAQGQRGNAVNTYLTTARQNAQNYAIARGTRGMNTDKAAADAASTATTTAEKTRHDKASEKAATDRTAASTQSAADRAAATAAKPNQYGVPASQWEHWSTSHRQRAIDAFKEKATQGADQKTAAKHATDVHAATGKVENTISDITGAWDSNVGKTTDDTSKPKDPKTGQYPARKLTPDDIKAVLQAQNKNWTPQLIHIALLRRTGQPLDQASVDYLHNLDPNFRIPRAWLPGGGVTANGPGDPKPTKGQQNGLGGK